jgi:hypothetical protein
MAVTKQIVNGQEVTEFTGADVRKARKEMMEWVRAKEQRARHRFLVGQLKWFKWNKLDTLTLEAIHAMLPREKGK